MRRTLSLLSLLFLVAACTPKNLTPETPDPEPEPEAKPKTEVTVSGVLHLMGDSLCCIWPESARPKAGWGEYLAAKLGGKAVVNNYAVSGRSTKSFLALGDWASPRTRAAAVRPRRLRGDAAPAIGSAPARRKGTA